MKEPRGCVRVLGQAITPQDLRTPGTRAKMSTRVLVEMEGRRQMQEQMQQMQQMQEQLNQMKELILAIQGGHNPEAPSLHHGSTSRQMSRVETDEDNDGEPDGVEEEDDEDIYFHRRVVPAAPAKSSVAPAKSSSAHQDESLLGMDVLLYAWTGTETLVAKATVISIDPYTIVGGEPLGPETYEVIVNVSLKKDATLPYQYDGLCYVSDVFKRSIAWPSSKMKPYRPGTSSSSHR